MDPNLPPSSPPHSPHHHTTQACAKCGTPTPFLTPPPPNTIPTYIPIQTPALNLHPKAHSVRQSIILSPVPKPLAVPILSPPYSFTIPEKKINYPEDVCRFHESESGTHFLGFLAALSSCMTGRKLSDPCHVSSVVQIIVDGLEELIKIVDQFPPLQQTLRYGDLEYRSWFDNMLRVAHPFMIRVCGDAFEAAAATELAPYFVDSFGNCSRIDYGTGHETNFAAWLYCLAKLGLIKEEDYQAVVSRVFVKYLDLMRRLQLDYRLEPAGSHGVWGLDDYHFLPYVFGSAQLIGHKYMKPKSIHNQDILDSFANEYMYLACIVFINKTKKGPFSEHSPLLNDISAVPNWNKVNSGSLKMYKAEVLEKIPIMQHFLFGSIIKWE